MYRTCLATLCATNCCDYYAYCVYPNQTPYCYKNVTYYYYDYTWVWIVCSILFVILAISIIAAIIRRRRMMRAAMQTTVIETNMTSPSIVQGQPVYGANQYGGNQYGGAVVYNNYNQPNSGYNQPVINQGYRR